MTLIEDKRATEALKSLMFVNLISADNDEYPEELKQDILTRYNSVRGSKSALDPNIDWKYVFQPLGVKADKCVKLMEAE